ncbi:NADH dehydrogenase [Hornefia porci]|uniref:NADH dehydrogenase n=1 Tax=Hornefia porci TaxID=2652292 RepID=A0A1Q9JFW2_9FIRM|nr:4Fe-4S dicluster domain-containing protein [Hornefia porci]OLR55126.1 NADH dehydrogenase [Hornefia porci]
MALLDQIKSAGVIGAGGAGFPTHAKLTSNADYILMNGAECEPLLRVDQQLMAMYPEEIIRGFEMAGRMVGAKQAIIGIKGKHGDVIQILRDTIDRIGFADYVSVGILPDIYPAGDEQVLVYQLTGRVVPEAGIPIMCGCVVMNSETALNVYNASKGIPVTETYVTVAGDIPSRLTLKVPVGTPVLDVLKLSGITDFSEYKVIDGGPMMGPLLADIHGFVVKKNKGYVILKKDHPLIRKKEVTDPQARKINHATCEQCRMCTDMCPRALIGHDTAPHKAMRFMLYGGDDMQGKTIGQLCCQCNLCEYFACPIGLHPKMANMALKDETMKAGVRFQRDENREYRPNRNRDWRLVPSHRLIARIGLTGFDAPAPMSDIRLEPQEVHIMLSQHVGAPAQPIVRAGDRVTAGQMIGRIPEDALGAAVHASIGGEVTEVTDKYIAIRR